MNFVIWVATGGMVSWLVARGEQRAAVGRFMMIGIIGAIVGGFLWFPFFSEVEKHSGLQPFFFPFFFDFVSFNVFAATFGSAIVHWVSEALVGQAK